MVQSLYRRGKIDFPWAYNSRCAHSDTRFGGGAVGQYPVISDEEALDLWAPWIDSLFHPEEAILFIWATWPKMPFWRPFIEACGFQYSSIGFIWVKTYSDTNRKFFQGPGFYTASNSEPCLIATRPGKKLKNHRRLQPQVHETHHELEAVLESICNDTIITPLLAHSEKPMEFTRRIDEMYPAQKYGKGIGLFERASQGEHWDVFGNEVDGSIPGPNFQQQKLNLGE